MPKTRAAKYQGRKVIVTRNTRRTLGQGPARNHIHSRIVRPELFLLSDETVRSCDMKEVEATYSDMASLDLDHLPYSHCIIGVPGRSIFHLTGIDVKIGKDGKYEINFKPGADIENIIKTVENFMAFEARFTFLDESFVHAQVRLNSMDKWQDTTRFQLTPKHKDEMEYSIGKSAYELRKLLIVLLATRNAIKTRTKDKLLALGIGKRKYANDRPLYTTTISLPRIIESEHDPIPTGIPKRPHLRRGHIRKQKYGPRLSFMKAIWIKPCFINTDDDFVSPRFAYNTSIFPPKPQPPFEPQP